MTPDPEQRLPRELLKELIEEGSDAFREVLEKLLNTAMQIGTRRVSGSSTLGGGASSVETTPTGTRPRRCQLEWDSFKSGFHKYVTWTSIPDPWSEGAARRKP